MNADPTRLARLRLPIKTLRWVLLALYVTLVLALLFGWLLEKDWLAVGIAAAIGLVAQVIFIVGAGRRDLCRPLRKRRLIVPVIVASLMFGLLALGLGLALTELFQLDTMPAKEGSYPILLTVFGENIYYTVFMLAIAASWLGWGILLFLYGRRWQRFRVLSRLTALLFCGSLAELLATIPSHIIVSKRPGCLVGLGTMLGILAGIYVMVWSFGPAIILLFLQPRYLQERAQCATVCPVCGHDLRGPVAGGRATCPECETEIPM